LFTGPVAAARNDNELEKKCALVPHRNGLQQRRQLHAPPTTKMADMITNHAKAQAPYFY
jgi:hypothetical protein